MGTYRHTSLCWRQEGLILAAGTTWVSIRSRGEHHARPVTWRGAKELATLCDELIAGLNSTGKDASRRAVAPAPGRGAGTPGRIRFGDYVVEESIARDLFDWLCMVLGTARPMKEFAISSDGHAITIQKPREYVAAITLPFTPGLGGSLRDCLLHATPFVTDSLIIEPFANFYFVRSAERRLALGQASFAELIAHVDACDGWVGPVRQVAMGGST